MEDPNASELIKKLAAGKISRKEFDLFLAKLDDKRESGNLEEGFWKLFAQYMDENNSDSKKDEDQ
jgi:hypothetical protein